MTKEKSEISIRIPEDAEYILNTLNEHGYEAYIVGGCVRDAILGRIPGDWDITSNAKPEEVKACFKRTIDTGIQHGTVTVMLHGVGYEVTTYRVDGEYLDGRHPESVSFTPDLKEDLKRRDFTMNAMAYHPREGLVDLFEGRKDMERHLVRCVGIAEERFTEDALRILRAIRFAAQLGFEIEEETQEAVKKLAPNLVHVSKERIQVELAKTLQSKNPDCAEKLWKAGILEQILPELVPVCEEGNGKKTDDALRADSIREASEKRNLLCIRLTLLLSQIPDQAQKVLKKLKFDNETIDTVKVLSKVLNREISKNDSDMRHLMHEIGVEKVPMLLRVKQDLEQISESEEQDDLLRYQGILDRGECTCLKQLAVNGSDLMEAGIPKGKILGETLNRLLEAVLEDPEKNTRETLLNLL